MDTTDILTDAFDRIPDIARRAVDGLSTEGLAYRPDADANSIAWLLWHLARVQDHHVSQLAGRSQAYLEQGWAGRLGLEPDPDDIGYGHTPAQVGAVRFDRSDEVLAYLDAVQARTLEYVRGADEDELGRIVDTRWDPPVTAGVRLVSVIGDCLQHLGQASYVRGLWDRLG
jgi:hypothetical protein